MNEHATRLQEEVEFHTKNKFQWRHPLNRWPLYSETRNLSAYETAKERLFNTAAASLSVPHSVLIAPAGRCHDYPFVRAVWPRAALTGIDITPYSGPEGVICGDMLNMPFENGRFDVAVTTLFFHHVFDEGLQPYLRELRRVSRSLVTMEPSTRHPLFLVTRPLMKMVGNITHQVNGEHPIPMSRLAEECRLAGYSSVQTFACSFAHNRLPIPFRPMVNLCCHVPAMKQLAWMFGLIAY